MFEKPALRSSKSYKFNVDLIKFHYVYHFVTAVLDTGAHPNLSRNNLILTSLILLIRPAKTSLISAESAAFKMRVVTCVLIDFGEEVVGLMLGVASLRATNVTLRTVIIDKSIRPFELECRRSVRGIELPSPVLASSTDDTRSHICRIKAKGDNREVICEAAKVTTVPSSSEAVLTMTIRSVGIFIVETKHDLTVQTGLTAA